MVTLAGADPGFFRGGGVRELLRESFGEATEGGLEYEVL